MHLKPTYLATAVAPVYGMKASLMVFALPDQCLNRTLKVPMLPQSGKDKRLVPPRIP